MRECGNFIANACVSINRRGARIPSEMRAGRHNYITDGTNASIVIYVLGNMHLLRYVWGET